MTQENKANVNIISRPALPKSTPQTFRTGKLADLLDHEDAKAAQNMRVAQWLRDDGNETAADKMEAEARGKREVIKELRREFSLPDELYDFMIENIPAIPKFEKTEE